MTEPHTKLPDFSDGELFLKQLRVTLHQRQLRNRAVATAATLFMAVTRFIGGFNAIQEQNYYDIWESYLIGEMTYEDVTPDMEADAALYLNMVLDEDLDDLLTIIYELGLEEELVFAYSSNR